MKYVLNDIRHFLLGSTDIAPTIALAGGAVDITSASETVEPGSYPIRVQCCIIDIICIACAMKREIKALAPKYYKNEFG
jgi:hypothetical protein